MNLEAQLGDPAKLARLKSEGLGDVSEFMGSFESGQQVADAVRCEMCTFFTTDLIDSALTTMKTNYPGPDDTVPAFGKGSIADEVETSIKALCDLGDEGAINRFLGLYDIRNCAAEPPATCQEGQLYRVVRETAKTTAEMERNNLKSREWQLDVHTVLCSRYWTPLTDDMTDAVSSAAAERAQGGEGVAVAEAARRFCAENDLCLAQKPRKKKHNKKKASKPIKVAQKVSGIDDLQKKIEQVQKARERGGDPTKAREEIWGQEFDAKVAAAKARAEQRKVAAKPQPKKPKQKKAAEKKKQKKQRRPSDGEL